MVFVTVSETYDLSTKVGKMALLGIHTPQSKIIRQCYPGFLMQYKYVRYVSCNVTMACASMLPADPLQVGTETGQISPSDMFNPILYKAVSNDSMSTLEGRLHLLHDAQYGVVKGPSVDADNNNVTYADNEKVYYALLSDRSGWRHAMPQQGLTIRTLVPMCFEVLAANGLLPAYQDSDTLLDGEKARYPDGIIMDGTASNDLSTPKYVGRFRGAPKPMPRIPTLSFTKDRTYAGFSDAINNDTMPAGNAVPPIYVAMIVMPPAKLTTMYYRLIVRWTLQFSEIRSQTEIAGWQALTDVGQTTYHSDYATQSKIMSTKADLADSSDAELKPVMVGA